MGYYHFKTHHLICECGSAEHTVRFMHDPEDASFYIDIFLYENKFLNRLWIGLKYIFGYKCQYGHWDCAMMYHEEAAKLRDYLIKSIEEEENVD